MMRDFLRAAALGWITLREAALSSAAWALGIRSGPVDAPRTRVLIRDFTLAFAAARLTDLRRCLSPDLIRFATAFPPSRATWGARQSCAILAREPRGHKRPREA
jgi:hypothetical protein